jgi:glucokinase
MAQQDALSLVADTGGTNTRMALARGGQILPDTTERFRNADFPGLTSIIAEYLSKHRVLPARAAFAAAGMSQGRRIELTNYGWYLDADEIESATGIRSAHLLNDLQAQGHAVPALPDSVLRPVRVGQPSGATRLVIGLGTGVNAAPVYPVGRGYAVPAAEAGHIHLPLRGALDYRLADWLVAQRGVASVEDVLAGSGLERLYAFHAMEAGANPDRNASQIMQDMAAGQDLACATGAHYVQLLARFSATLALATLPYAGIFLIGGVARAFGPYLDQFGFDDAFTQMGRMSDLAARFPVALVEDDFAALQGCASYLSAL